ncbi:MAG: sce7726 family protein [Lachnospiraceae bacterium]|nr:sce7726 family protein [Lachnospiraceae bacterium]
MIHDKDIREPLFDFLEETYGKIRILEEKMMGRSRADVVMVTETGLYGIEIKSDADSYTRLSRQIKDYDKYYDYNIAVVGTTHAGSIKEHVPEWWGVITVEEVDGVLDFYYYRKPQKNPKVDMKYKITILWRPELAHIQELNGMHRYTDKSKRFVMEKIIAIVPAEILDKQISEELFERDYTRIEETLNEFRNRKRGRRKML